MDSPKLPGSLLEEPRAPPRISQQEAADIVRQLDAACTRHARELRQIMEGALGPQVPPPDSSAPLLLARLDDGIETHSVGKVMTNSEGNRAKRVLPEPEVATANICEMKNGVMSRRDVGFEGDAVTLHTEWSRRRHDNYLQWFVTHPKYEAAVGVAICLNVLTMSWEAQSKGEMVKAALFAAPDENFLPAAREEHFLAFSWIFCMVFLADILLRIYSLKWGFICHRGRLAKDAKWNIFDTVCVVGYLAEIFLDLTKVKGGVIRNLGIIRVIRMARMIRIFNVLRTITWFRDLRIMVSSMVDAMVPLVWFCVIVTLVLISLGVVFTTATTDHIASLLESNRNLHSEELLLLEDYYGTLSASMLSLFSAITGGDDWQNTAKPLRQLPSVYVGFFYAYIAFALFAMINVGSAIFLDAVLQRSKHDRDYVIDAMTQEKKIFMRLMDNLFAELDKDASGHISLEELKDHLSNPEVTTFLSALNLDVKQVSQLFRLMDYDRSGTIDKYEFREGCDKLRGEARQLDLAILELEVVCCQTKLKEILDYLKPKDRLEARTYTMQVQDQAAGLLRVS